MEQLDLKLIKSMMAKGAKRLSKQAETINALNVFPVPDGDTGTNMNLTFQSGMKELERIQTGDVCHAAEAFSKGLLMGARGNSGVILSQLFRGFSRSLSGKKPVTSVDFANGLQAGVDHAYKAVMKPVEGTILTVAKDSAKRAVEVSAQSRDLEVVMEEVVQAAKRSLKRTPDLLPVLKEVGVVDSGGQGLVTIYEGFLEGLSGKALRYQEEDGPRIEEMIKAVHHKKVQQHWKTEDIHFGYCTEFMVQLKEDSSFEESSFRKELDRHGDSLLVVSDPELVKVHIHTERPGDMLSIGQRYGELVNMKIENMRRQHRDIVDGDHDKKMKNEEKVKPFGFVAVASGEGLTELFKSMGVDEVIQGGQTMNPSIEDLANAVRECRAEYVFLLPNNSNVILASEQVREVVEEKVTVIPSKTIPQGLAALVAFNPTDDPKSNETQMIKAMEHVKSAQVTFAVRDTNKDGFEIKKDDFLAIVEGKIVATEKNRLDVAKRLIEKVVSREDEIVTVLTGNDVPETESEELVQFIESHFLDIELEIHNGGQPVYAYIISVE